MARIAEASKIGGGAIGGVILAAVPSYFNHLEKVASLEASHLEAIAVRLVAQADRDRDAERYRIDIAAATASRKADAEGQQAAYKALIEICARQ